MRVKVKSAQVFERKVHSTKHNKDYTFREQEALVQVGDETRIIVLSLEEEQVGYAPGEYEVLETSFEVDRDRRLAFRRRLALKPVAVAAAPGARLG